MDHSGNRRSGNFTEMFRNDDKFGEPGKKRIGHVGVEMGAAPGGNDVAGFGV
jgi:hypothetical protein